MSFQSSFALSRNAILTAMAALALPLMTACPSGDVGAPCNHGPGEPTSKLVTFPALSCDDLICVYASSNEPPDAPCDDDTDCAAGGAAEGQFICDTSVTPGVCRVDDTYVLSRSMCSKRCSSDADCENSGITTEKKPVTDDTNCEGGFKCARLQELGEFCCERLCVCDDDLGSTIQIDELCATDVDGMPGPDICAANAG